ncbi:MAG: hypothetical protein ACI8QS_000323 [Planctomycetota bacterium]|jgi:hypothetical protein
MQPNHRLRVLRRVNLLLLVLTLSVILGQVAVARSHAFSNGAPASGAPSSSALRSSALRSGALRSGGKIFLSVEEALDLAFQEAEVTRTTVYLNAEQEQRASKLAGHKIGTRVVHAYTARNAKGKVIGVAYFDSHRVRSKRETLMIVVDPNQKIRRVEILAFAEPEEYIPRAGFYAQLHGRVLDKNFALGRGIRGVSGASMTATATVRAARQVLALHQVVREADKSESAVR